MKTTDKAADSTLSELFDDICHSSFHPQKIAADLNDKDIIGDPVCLECERDDLPAYERRMAIVNALRSNGKQGVFQTFVAVIESDPENSDIVKKVKGINDLNRKFQIKIMLLYYPLSQISTVIMKGIWMVRHNIHLLDLFCIIIILHAHVQLG